MDVARIMQVMIERGWRPAGPPADGLLAQIEREYDVTLPADFRHYLATVGGGEALAPESYTGLWSAQGILVLNRRYKIPWNFPGLLGIGNDGFMTYAIDFRDGTVIASLGLSSSSWDDVVTEADTFAEWLERRLP